MTDFSKPAFPRPDSDTYHEAPGMSLREYYAGQAMQGLMAGSVGTIHAFEIAAVSRQFADALIAELYK